MKKVHQLDHAWKAGTLAAICLLIIAIGALQTEAAQTEDRTYTWTTDSSAIGESFTIPSVCDLTIHSVAVGYYAMAIAPFERDEEALYTLPGIIVRSAAEASVVSQFDSGSRYKFEKNGNLDGYADIYVAINRALKASTADYRLLDIRVCVLNRQKEAMDIQETFSATLQFDEEYEFDSRWICAEGADISGSSAEWLVDGEAIPPLLYRTVHFIFEVPALVAGGEELLTADLRIGEEGWHVQLR